MGCIPSMDGRRMRGEDLHGLNIEELQQLEKALEVGLSRVLETKVGLHLLPNITMYRCLFCSNFFFFNYFQGERIMNEISTLERKVRMLQISWYTRPAGQDFVKICPCINRIMQESFFDKKI